MARVFKCRYLTTDISYRNMDLRKRLILGAAILYLVMFLGFAVQKAGKKYRFKLYLVNKYSSTINQINLNT